MKFKKENKCFIKVLLMIGLLVSLCSDHSLVKAEEIGAELRGREGVATAEQPIVSKSKVLDEEKTCFVVGNSLLLGSDEAEEDTVTNYGLTQSGVTVTYLERVDDFIRPDSDMIGNGTATEVNPACAIKYIADDWEHGESYDASGNSRCRYVYCTQYQKDSPAGQVLTKSGYLNRFVHFVMYHGAMYYGELCRHTPYSTGNWRYDYLVTQMAIHIVNGEYTLDNLTRAINMSNASDEDKALVIDRISAMVRDAWAVGDGAHPGWDQDGWYRADDTENNSFSLSEVLDHWTFGGDGYYYTDWIKPLFTTKGGYYANYDISSLSHETTEGVQVSKMYAESSFSPYRLAIPWETYEAWRTTGKTVTSTVTIKVPSHWKVTEFTTSGGNTFQNVCFITSTAQETTYRASISIQIPQATGSLSVKKRSSNPDMTQNHSSYSLEGAKFELYKVEADGTLIKQKKIYTTDKNGAFTVKNLPIGRYRLKEITPPKGFLLETNESKDIVVTVDQTTEVIITNTPKSLPVSVLLQKKDSETGLPSPQGTGSMADAEFTVQYYPVIMDTDPALSGHKPVRTWVIKTNESGYSGLSDPHFVRGDSFYRNESGTVVCPYGTLTIRETKPPKGYLLNTDLFITKITDSANGTIALSCKPIIKDRVNELKIIKKRQGTDDYLQNVVFELEYPDGTKERAITDTSGTACFKGLPEGDYVLREVETGPHYQLCKDTVHFQVNEKHQIVNGVVQQPEHNDHGLILIEYDSRQNAVVTMENKTKDYSIVIHKTDKKSRPLDGAEFTLYEDKGQKTVFQKGITTDGVLTLDGLKIGQKYYLVETKAPDGYSIELDEQGCVPVYEIAGELDKEQHFIFKVNGEVYQCSGEKTDLWIYFSDVSDVVQVNMKIENQANTTFPEIGTPKTGDSSDFVLYTALILGSIVILFLGMFLWGISGLGREDE